MSANDLLTLIIEAIFILLSILTTVEWLRHRGAVRRDIALMFGSLSLLYIIQIFESIGGLQLEWLNLIATLSVLAQPYLLLRLLRYFRPVSSRFMKAAFAGMLLCWLALLIPPIAQSILALLLIVVYFSGVDGYAMVGFIRGALTASGVVRQRLRFAAIGSGLLASILLILGVMALIPSFLEPGTGLVEVAAISAAISYYIGFAPPRWLRRAWQTDELLAFLEQASQSSISRLSPDQGLNNLCSAALRAVGGFGAAVVQQTESGWKVRSISDPMLANIPNDGAEIFTQIWKARVPSFIRLNADSPAGERQLQESVGANTMFGVPIATTERDWGLLVVFQRYGSLFVEDDLSLITVLAQQNAIILENSLLIEEHRTYAQKLEVVNKELEAFSYSVSHDLRAPLRTLDGFSQAVLEDYGELLDDTGRNLLKRIRAASQRMGQLIDDLLQLSRLSRTEMRFSEVDLSAMAKEIVADLKEQYRGREVQFTHSDGLVAKGDARLLRVALSNLLGNAWKFTGKQPNACVEFGVTERDLKRVFFVRDNGAGFDMAYANKLFGAFQRLHSTSEFEGTGIGLATVQRVLQRHGGQIWAESVVDEGSTFFFTL